MPAFSLNCVMRFSQPMRATQLKIQASSACCTTRLWLKTMCFFGSMPAARNAAVTSRVARISSAGSCQMRDRMQVDDAIDAVVALLQLHEAADRAEIIAEMEVAGRLDAGKDKRLEAGHSFSSWLVEGRFARGENPGDGALMDERAFRIKSR